MSINLRFKQIIAVRKQNKKKAKQHLQEEEQGLLEEQVHKRRYQHKGERKDYPNIQLSPNPLMKLKGLLLTEPHFQ